MGSVPGKISETHAVKAAEREIKLLIHSELDERQAEMETAQGGTPGPAGEFVDPPDSFSARTLVRRCLS